MEPFFIYLAKATGLLLLFFAAYNFLLKKETFFIGNRYFLLAGLGTAALLPLVFYTKTVWVNPVPALPQNSINPAALMAMQQTVTQQPVIGFMDIALGIYLLGILLFIARFITDLIYIREALSSKVVRQGNFRLVDSASIPSPFSFFNFIAYNSAALQPHELESVIAHEKVHSRQGHSLDMIAGHMLCIVFWFNPVAWLYKKAISQNLEFIADALASSQVPDKVAYQKTMLKFSVQPQFISITNHFYQSLIKKRIVMLNKKQSQKHSAWKYTIVLPALVAFICMFQVKVVAQEKKAAATIQKIHTNGASIHLSAEITKDSDDKSFESFKKIFKSEFDAELTISNITRNKTGEITAIKVMVKDQDHLDAYPVYHVEADKDNHPITTFTILIARENATAKNEVSFTTATMPADVKATRIIVSAQKDSIIKTVAAVKDSINRYNIDQIDTVVMIDGVIQKNGNPITIPIGREIDEVAVFKGKEDLKLYGITNKNGLIKITTKKVDITAPKLQSYPGKKMNYTVASHWFNTDEDKDISFGPSATVIKNTSGPVRVRYTQVTTSAETKQNFTSILNGDVKGVDYKNATIYIDGKEVSPLELKRLNPSLIYTCHVVPGRVVGIEGQRVQENDGKAVIIVTKDFANAAKRNDSNGFLIHKDLKENDLKQYAEELKKDGIIFKYRKLKYNDDGEISSIKIELEDSATGNKSSGSFSNDKGVPKIFIGQKNGVLLIDGKSYGN